MELPSTGTAPPQINREEASFERVFKEHFRSLHAYAAVMVKDEELAEDLVQQMFLKLWERGGLSNIQTSVKAFLYKCIHNDCLNYLKHLKVRAGYEDHAVYAMKAEHHQFIQAEYKDLEARLRNALAELPEQCLTIFQMSRFEELKYREIAEKLGLSVKTVEKQMGKALKLLRLKLVDFLPLIFMLLMPERFK
ncbi:MAG TPA: RNA polymerase sigma-70 factor [Sphingobacteriaceae bacterium]